MQNDVGSRFYFAELKTTRVEVFTMQMQLKAASEYTQGTGRGRQAEVTTSTLDARFRLYQQDDHLVARNRHTERVLLSGSLQLEWLVMPQELGKRDGGPTPQRGVSWAKSGSTHVKTHHATLELCRQGTNSAGQPFWDRA
jgi:hypothetical protein